MTGPLADRTVLITGAGAGVGRGVAMACAAAGADVVVAAPRDNGAATVKLITDRGQHACWVRCDVTRGSDVEDAVAAAVDRSGRLDVIVHNATSRASNRVAALAEVGPEEWEDHASVSLRGAYHCARAGLPWLSQQGGRFILMTSPAGMEGSVTLPLYGAVKAALRGLAKSLAREWGPLGVNVTCVSPLAQTDALVRAYEENPVLEERLRTLVPLGRIGDPETDIGPAVVFLASDASRYITGQTLVVDGGRYTGL